jgi:hypothetical protein
MRIDDVRLRHVTGRMPFDGDFWEERLIRPVDLYPSFRAQGAEFLPKDGDDAYRIETYFVEILTDAGVIGIGGPITREQAYLIDVDLRRYLVGADPLANELIWDTLYRASVHGRKGINMLAISAIDCALWDLKGRYFEAALRFRPMPAHSATRSSRVARPSERASSSGRAMEPPSGFSAMVRPMDAMESRRTCSLSAPCARRSATTST